MKRLTVAKSAVCLGVAVTMLASGPITTLRSATLFKEVGLAGIALSLDNYYAKNLESSLLLNEQISVASTNSSILSVGETDNVEVVVQEKEEEKVSEYANVGISIASDYVNIRAKANEKSKVRGKLYKGSSATIVARKGDWVKIESGKVKGYIKADYLAIGFSAEELVDKYGTKWATVNTTTLKVREERNLDSVVVTLVPIEEEFEIIKEYKDWVKILVDEGDGENATKGFVSKEYVDIHVTFEQAISIKEEQAKIKAAEEARLAEEQAAANLREAAQASERARNIQRSSNTSRSNSSYSSKRVGSGNTNVNKSVPVAPTGTSSGSGSQIASFAQKFVGNPYVWGGTSLTNGADCSGFVQTVYRNFGVSLPRTSGSQSGAGSSINVSSAQAGDLIFYASNGRVNHVAICIGGGQVVHASNKKTGIKISNMYYRTPYCARRVLN